MDANRRVTNLDLVTLRHLLSLDLVVLSLFFFGQFGVLIN